MGRSLSLSRSGLPPAMTAVMPPFDRAELDFAQHARTFCFILNPIGWTGDVVEHFHHELIVRHIHHCEQPEDTHTRWIRCRTSQTRYRAKLRTDSPVLIRDVHARATLHQVQRKPFVAALDCQVEWGSAARHLVVG